MYTNVHVVGSCVVHSSSRELANIVYPGNLHFPLTHICTAKYKTFTDREKRQEQCTFQ